MKGKKRRSEMIDYQSISCIVGAINRTRITSNISKNQSFLTRECIDLPRMEKVVSNRKLNQLFFQ